MQAKLPVALPLLQQPVLVPVGKEILRKECVIQIGHVEVISTPNQPVGQVRTPTEVYSNPRVHGEPAAGDSDDGGANLAQPPKGRTEVGASLPV
jgi:hypothetical protein